MQDNTAIRTLGIPQVKNFQRNLSPNKEKQDGQTHLSSNIREMEGKLRAKKLSRMFPPTLVSSHEL